MGIEPTRSAWEAEVLPLNYTCKWLSTGLLIHILSKSGENVNISAHFSLQKPLEFCRVSRFSRLKEGTSRFSARMRVSFRARPSAFRACV